jgi:DNA-binding NarL/FixJ family response regulator
VVAGSRRPAEVALGRAKKLATGLGARLLVHEIDMLARRARLDLAPEKGEGPAAATAPATPSLGLTERELEVLGHPSLGRTNTEIAALLFISPKTASVHVSNIMRKLGVSNRIAAARIGQKAGLTERNPAPDHS